MSPKAGYSTCLPKRKSQWQFSMGEADQPSLKLKQLPTFYAFWAGFGIMLTSVARTLHFWGPKLP
jgi:hypothetical protein